MLNATYSNTYSLLKDLLVMELKANTFILVDIICFISPAGPQSHSEHHLAQSAGHQETPPIASGGLLSAPHRIDTLPKHLYSQRTTRVHFLLHCPSASCILHAPVSALCCEEAHPLPTTKGASEASRERHPHTVHQTKVNTKPDAGAVTEQGPAH